MLTDGQLYNLFAESLVDEPADPTFLDELFETLLEEVRTAGLATATARPRPMVSRRSSAWSQAPRWLAFAAAAVVLAIGIQLLLRLPSVGPPSTPTPSPSPSFPALSGSFTSAIGGYSISYPEGAEIDAATEPIAPGLHSWNPDQPWVDNVLDPSGLGQWTIVSAEIPVGTTAAQWIADQLDAQLLSGTAFPACGPATTTEPITIDVVEGVIDTHCPTIWLDGVVASQGRGYVFSLLVENPSMEWYRTVLGTVQLDPAAAAPYVSPGPTIQATPAAS